MPDGSTKVPANTPARIEEFKAKTAAEVQRQDDRQQMTREIEQVKREIAHLKSAAMTLAAILDRQPVPVLARPGLPPATSAISTNAISAPTPTRSALTDSPPVAIAPANAQVVLTVQAPSDAATPARIVPAPAQQNAAPTSPKATSDPPPANNVVQQRREPATSPQPPINQAPVPSRFASDELNVAPPTEQRPQAVQTATLSTLRRFQVRLDEAGAFTPPQPLATQLLGAAKSATHVVILVRPAGAATNAQALRVATDRGERVRAYLTERGIAANRISLRTTSSPQSDAGTTITAESIEVLIQGPPAPQRVADKSSNPVANLGASGRE